MPSPGRDVGVALRPECRPLTGIRDTRLDSWNLFFKADADPEADVEAALADWEQSQGLLPNHVQWIGANRPEQASPKRDRRPLVIWSCANSGSK